MCECPKYKSNFQSLDLYINKNCKVPIAMGIRTQCPGRNSSDRQMTADWSQERSVQLLSVPVEQSLGQCQDFGNLEC